MPRGAQSRVQGEIRAGAISVEIPGEPPTEGGWLREVVEKQTRG